MLAEKRLNGYCSDDDKEREPAPVDLDGYIDFKVDFTKSLSEKDENSWQEMVTDPSEDEYDAESGSFQEEVRDPFDFLNNQDGPEVIYNIHGEIIGPDSVLKQIAEVKEKLELEAQAPSTEAQAQESENKEIDKDSFSAPNSKNRLVINVA